MAVIGDDCHYFYTGQCRKGDRCQYRHVEEAVGSHMVCSSWLDSPGCFIPHCPYRHSHLQVNEPYWEDHTVFPPPLPVVPTSSLVSVPLVGNEPPYEPSYNPDPYSDPGMDGYYEPEVGAFMGPDEEFYPGGDHGDLYNPDADFPEGEHGPSQAAVIITQRHDEFFPPQVQPVVVRIGSHVDSSDTDDSQPAISNLSALRRIETCDDINTPDLISVPRQVIPKVGTEGWNKDRIGEDHSDRVRAHRPHNSVGNVKKVSPTKNVISEPNRQDVFDSPRTISSGEGKNDDESGDDGESEASVDESEAGSGEIETSEGEVEQGSASEIDDEDDDKESQTGSGSGSETADSGSENSISGTGNVDDPQTETEPELVLFDDEDTGFGEVEQTPISVKQKRFKEAPRRKSRDKPRDKPERRTERNRRDLNKKRARSLSRSRSKRSAPINLLDSPRKSNLKADNNQNTSRTNSPNRPAPSTGAAAVSKKEKKEEQVEVLSLEELMRKKALESMIERRKQKEMLAGNKEGGSSPANTVPESRPSTNPPRKTDDVMSRRNDDVTQRRNDDVRRRSPPDVRGGGGGSKSRHRSPPRGQRYNNNPNGPYKNPSDPYQNPSDPYTNPPSDPYSDYEAPRGPRWRPRDRRDYYPRYQDSDRSLTLIKAQSDLIEKMSHLASGGTLMGEKDLKKQQKLLKKQLKKLDKEIARQKSESESSSYCSTCSDYSEYSSSEEERKARKKKHKKKRKSERKRSPRLQEEEDEEESNYDDFSVLVPVPVENASRSNSAELSLADLRRKAAEKRREMRENERLEKEKRKEERRKRRQGLLTTPISPERRFIDANQVDDEIEQNESENESEDDKPKVKSAVLPRAKIVIVNEEGNLNISGSDLLGVMKPEVISAIKAASIGGRRKIQLKKAATLNNGSGDDEASRQLLEKIKQTAVIDARRQVQVGHATMRRSSTEGDLRTGTVLQSIQPVRKIQLSSALKKSESTKTSPTDGKMSPDLESTLTDNGKRRIIRRTPASVYVPPSIRGQGQGRGSGDGPDTKPESAFMKTVVRDGPKVGRSLTPDISTSPLDGSTTARRSTMSDIRATANTPTGKAESPSETKFELGVKTFADIMREKKERKVLELEQKRRLGDGVAAQEPTPKVIPKLSRTSVKTRLGPAPTDQSATTTTSSRIAPVAPLASGSRTLQQYDDDWMTSSSRSPSFNEDSLLRDSGAIQRRTLNLASTSLKRQRTLEPSKKYTFGIESSNLKRQRTEPIKPATKTLNNTNTIPEQKRQLPSMNMTSSSLDSAKSTAEITLNSDNKSPTKVFKKSVGKSPPIAGKRHNSPSVSLISTPKTSEKDSIKGDDDDLDYLLDDDDDMELTVEAPESNEKEEISFAMEAITDSSLKEKMTYKPKRRSRESHSELDAELNLLLADVQQHDPESSLTSTSTTGDKVSPHHHGDDDDALLMELDELLA